MTETKDHDTQLVVSDGRSLTDGFTTIRPLLLSDIPAVREAVSDPHARRMLAHWAHLSGSARNCDHVLATTLFNDKLRLPREPFAIVAADASVIGARWLDHGGHGPTLTGGWVHIQFRGRGYGSGAMRLVQHHAARTHGAELMETGTRHDNVIAQRNLSACGWNYVGISIRPGLSADEDTDPTGDPPTSLQVWQADIAALAQLGPIPGL